MKAKNGLALDLWGIGPILAQAYMQNIQQRRLNLLYNLFFRAWGYFEKN